MERGFGELPGEKSGWRLGMMRWPDMWGPHVREKERKEWYRFGWVNWATADSSYWAEGFPEALFFFSLSFFLFLFSYFFYNFCNFGPICFKPNSKNF
jgi:hypothetical protein